MALLLVLRVQAFEPIQGHNSLDIERFYIDNFDSVTVLYFYDSDGISDTGFFQSIANMFWGGNNNEDILNKLTLQYHVMKLDIVEKQIADIAETMKVYQVPWIMAYHQEKLLVSEQPTYASPDNIDNAALKQEKSDEHIKHQFIEITEKPNEADFGHLVAEPEVEFSNSTVITESSNNTVSEIKENSNSTETVVVSRPKYSSYPVYRPTGNSTSYSTSTLPGNKTSNSTLEVRPKNYEAVSAVKVPQRRYFNDTASSTMIPGPRKVPSRSNRSSIPSSALVGNSTNSSEGEGVPARLAQRGERPGPVRVISDSRPNSNTTSTQSNANIST